MTPPLWTCSPGGDDNRPLSSPKPAPANTHRLVFTRPDGQPIHPHSISQAFDRAQRHLDVSPIRFHDLRHTHASLLLRDRVPIKVVSERLGHSNPAFTMTTYQHVLPGMQDDAAAAFGQLLASHSRECDEAAAAA
ncbi:MAG TPA: tyrosine-type recombinase/integrase [Acidimicrobiales bacterium]|nr:tyrosine-type recombinase/integrase [Acidimicrobiales bacterium]